MKDSIKKGFGFVIGMAIGKEVVDFVKDIGILTTFKTISNNDDYMNYAKENDPDQYEKLKHFRTKTEEEES